MKLPPFEYACPTTLAEAVALLASQNGEAKAIAGGQSLVPMLAFRVAAPTLLVDLRKLGLNRITIAPDGVRLGAMVRWRDIEDDARLATAHPLLQAAVAHVAHYLMTALASDEIIVEVRLPAWPARRRWGFQEFARRRGDFALAAAAVFYDEDESGKAGNAHVGVVGVGDIPQRLPAAEAALNGRAVDEATIAEVEKAAAGSVDPQDDIHASAAYRRALAGTMVERALKSASA